MQSLIVVYHQVHPREVLIRRISGARKVLKRIEKDPQQGALLEKKPTPMLISDRMKMSMNIVLSVK